VVTLSGNDAGAKLATTVQSLVTATLHVEAVTLVQLLDHPVNTESGSGVAVSVTTGAGVAFGTTAVHDAVPHASATPSALTLPRPVPLVITVSGNVAGAKVAETVCRVHIVAVHPPPATLEQPDHPVKIEFASGVAVSTTSIGGLVFATFAVHTAPLHVSDAPTALT
jgi:hypothetical protein